MYMLSERALILLEQQICCRKQKNLLPLYTSLFRGNKQQKYCLQKDYEFVIIFTIDYGYTI